MLKKYIGLRAIYNQGVGEEFIDYLKSEC